MGFVHGTHPDDKPYVPVGLSDPTTAPPIFVVGCPRSGTTLLRVILDSHPSIACGPEFRMGPVLCNGLATMLANLPTLQHHYIGQADLIREFAGVYRRLLDRYRFMRCKPRIAEKTPVNVFYVRHLRMMFPESPIIHIVRDGRDVVASLLKQKWDVPWTKHPIQAAEHWVNCVRSGCQLRGDRWYMELQYEEIIAQPEQTLRAVFYWLGEPWDDKVMAFNEQPHHLPGECSSADVQKPLYTNAVGKWKTDLTEPDKVMEIAGPLLKELGYD